ncbi:MAG: hypothetical protein KKA81_07005 [Bacteroidetes bacterium]|nr:hypothetical protein [Bacteroidota bacterium]
MVVDLKANEMVTKAGDVKFHALNGEIKGKLILTNQRIYFKPIENDDHNYNLEILPDEIKELLYFKTGFFSNNGLIFMTKEGKELRFIVKNRDTWSQMINKMY